MAASSTECNVNVPVEISETCPESDVKDPTVCTGKEDPDNVDSSRIAESRPKGVAQKDEWEGYKKHRGRGRGKGRNKRKKDQYGHSQQYCCPDTKGDGSCYPGQRHQYSHSQKSGRDVNCRDGDQSTPVSQDDHFQFSKSPGQQKESSGLLDPDSQQMPCQGTHQHVSDQRPVRHDQSIEHGEGHSSGLRPGSGQFTRERDSDTPFSQRDQHRRNKLPTGQQEKRFSHQQKAPQDRYHRKQTSERYGHDFKYGESPNSGPRGSSSYSSRERDRNNTFSPQGGHQWNNTPSSGGKHHQSNRQGRLSSGRRQEDPDLKLSKQLSFILRHGAEKQGFILMEGGFLYVNDLLERDNLKTYTVSDVQRVVNTNDKKRFHLENDESGRLKIRANQGHTLGVEGLELTEITSAEEFPVVVHGTYMQNWESIKKQGLSKMKRTHIHCAPGVPGETDVISGMRRNCDTIIYINLEAALKDGLKFFRSANNVILTGGNQEGVLLPKYFQKVVNRKTGEELPLKPV